ncbi:transcription antitermination factor NusB [Candidatus Dependentiae bacterium]
MSLSGEDIVFYDKLSRRDKRSLIFHLLYAVESFNYDVSVESVVDNLNRGLKLDIPDDSEVLKVAKQVIDEKDELDTLIEPLLDNWRLERIGVCTKLILRLSIWELRHTDTPANIIINEAIELAKCFSEKDAYRFVNGILDEVCKEGKKDEEEQPSKEEG